MGRYCMYLRKSRADAEAEAHGEGETLARHKAALLNLANSKQIAIASIYKEIVSGESIKARPIMQKLLDEVQAGLWSGVLVMEVERLARGDTIDQGVVARAFCFSHTKIITPIKTYDPDNEYDEEYFEFGLFMSRREYKAINRRLQRGRIASSTEGKFIGSIAPYGYIKTKLVGQKGFTLKPDPLTSYTVKLIYEQYTTGEISSDGSKQRLGIAKIAEKLNSLKLPPPRSELWCESTVQSILRNPVYIGKIRSMERPVTKLIENGSVIITRPRNQNFITFDGLHEPLIDLKIWELAQDYSRMNVPRESKYEKIKNPLAGIVICGKCGKTMVRKPYNKSGKQLLVCTNKYCDNVSANLVDVESRIIEALISWLKGYEFKKDSSTNEFNMSIDSLESMINKNDHETSTLEMQQMNLHDLLEQRVYSEDIFLKRQNIIENKKAALLEANAKLLKELTLLKSQVGSEPEVLNIEELFKSKYLHAPLQVRHQLWLSLLEKIVYTKNKKYGPFKLILYPKIPRSALDIKMDLMN